MLDSVLNDSRCPTGAECIWAGNAAVRFTYTSASSKVSFVLNTISSFRTDSLIEGYRIRMTKLSPYPVLGVAIKQSDYKGQRLEFRFLEFKGDGRAVSFNFHGNLGPERFQEPR